MRYRSYASEQPAAKPTNANSLSVLGALSDGAVNTDHQRDDNENNDHDNARSGNKKSRGPRFPTKPMQQQIQPFQYHKQVLQKPKLINMSLKRYKEDTYINSSCVFCVGVT